MLSSLDRRCITNDNMLSLRSKLDDDVENLDGLPQLDPASQEQVREAFAAGEVLDKTWTGVICSFSIGQQLAC